MKEKRIHARYDVSQFPEMRASTLNGPIGERLMTISVGGCGFWAPAEDFNLTLGTRISLTIEIVMDHPKQLELKGELLYILPHPLDSQIGRFYGVRFREEDQAQVEEAIEQLEALYQEGRIQMA